VASKKSSAFASQLNADGVDANNREKTLVEFVNSVASSNERVGGVDPSKEWKRLSQPRSQEVIHIEERQPPKEPVAIKPREKPAADNLPINTDFFEWIRMPKEEMDETTAYYEKQLYETKLAIDTLKSVRQARFGEGGEGSKTPK